MLLLLLLLFGPLVPFPLPTIGSIPRPLFFDGVDTAIPQLLLPPPPAPATCSRYSCSMDDICKDISTSLFTSIGNTSLPQLAIYNFHITKHQQQHNNTKQTNKHKYMETRHKHTKSTTINKTKHDIWSAIHSSKHEE